VKAISIFSAGFLVLAAGAAHAQNVQCPPRSGAGALANVSVFDGPPEEQADLVPDINRHSSASVRMEWRFEARADNNYYLQCKYTAGAEPIVLKVDQTARLCAFRREGKSISATCR
jgi:hypothetical protein